MVLLQLNLTYGTMYYTVDGAEIENVVKKLKLGGLDIIDYIVTQL